MVRVSELYLRIRPTERLAAGLTPTWDERTETTTSAATFAIRSVRSQPEGPLPTMSTLCQIN